MITAEIEIFRKPVPLKTDNNHEPILNNDRGLFDGVPLELVSDNHLWEDYTDEGDHFATENLAPEKKPCSD